VTRTATLALGAAITLIGVVVGLWPMSVTVLGTSVGAKPAPFMLLDLLKAGRPDAGGGALLGDVAANMWDSLVYEAAVRTGLALVLFIGGVIALAVGYLQARDPRTPQQRDYHH